MPHPMSATRGFRPHRIEDTGHDAMTIIQALAEHSFERLLLAEGDSWFDLFTPLVSRYQPNLLSAIRTPRQAALVDLSHVGDTAEAMTSGWQAIGTTRILDLIPFDVWLVSAGGNDLKNIFTALYGKAALSRRAGFPSLSAAEARAVAAPGTADAIYDTVIDQIVTLVTLRDASKLNSATPMIFHGYDYLQPRPAPAVVIAPLSRGPWIYPVLHEHGMNDTDMRQAAHEVLDTFNDKLAKALRGLPNVHFLDQRATLTLAAAGTTGASNDWADEIHPLPSGFEKLANAFWNPLLARLIP